MPRLARTVRPGRVRVRARWPTFGVSAVQSGTASPLTAARRTTTSVVASRPTTFARAAAPSGRPTAMSSSHSTL